MSFILFPLHNSQSVLEEAKQVKQSEWQGGHIPRGSSVLWYVKFGQPQVGKFSLLPEHVVHEAGNGPKHILQPGAHSKHIGFDPSS